MNGVIVLLLSNTGRSASPPQSCLHETRQAARYCDQKTAIQRNSATHLRQ
ncbi:hypothetical protein A0123_03022 [Gluconobacter cerinus]|uniref:Uncharacterized protein n=1 Tax=Gluconobacter cerinus TaxID=38307 RepID=A0A1B6VGK1_9PROT|nr:hypothetical protein A0123_03022 [Gluconobacter cerinus]